MVKKRRKQVWGEARNSTTRFEARALCVAHQLGVHAWGRQREPLDAYVFPGKAFQQPNSSLYFIGEGLIDAFFLLFKLFERGHASRASVQGSP